MFAEPYQNNSGGETKHEYKKGEAQGPGFKDLPFGIVFVCHIVAMGFVAVVYGKDLVEDALANANGNADANNAGDEAGVATGYGYNGYIYAAVSSGVLTMALSSVVLLVMIKMASLLIKLSLVLSVVLAGLSVLASVVAGNLLGIILGAAFFALSVCYARLVWRRIPFATSTLVTGLTAVRSNFGVVFGSWIVMILGFGWTLLWTVAFIGVEEKTKTCSVDAQTGEEVCAMNYGFLFLLLVSFYWTHQVFKNIVQVSVSGVVGTWWFTPEEANSCCSSGVGSSFFRAVTYSFGSICLGSLIVAILQALRQLANEARRNGDGNQFLLCIVECILGCIESLVEFFNKWAYVYVGLYGYGYIESGKNVMALFRLQGWEVIIADDLVDNCLGLVSLLVGLLMGGLTVIFASTTNWFDSAADLGIAPELVGFLIGLIVGVLISSVMLNVVSGAVNAVIVLFAEAPGDFQANYPQLSNQMREGWLQVYPAINLG